MSNKRQEISLTIAIPVYNEEQTITKVLSQTAGLKIENYEIVIINDASKDNSLSLIKDFIKANKKKTKIRLVNHPRNRGKGAGIKSALKFARGNYFVIQDADLEYNPNDIPKLLRLAERKNLDVVYGSRFKGDFKNMPRPNYYANKMYNFILRRLYKTKITDMHTCYKMIKTHLLLSFNMKSEGFGYASELVSNVLKRGIDIQEVPISFNGRTKKEGKKIDFIDGLECIRDLLHYRFRKGSPGGYGNFKILIKFGVVGVVGFFVNYATLSVLHSILDIEKVLSEVLAAAVALQVTFLLHDHWTYRIGATRKKLRLSMASRYVSYIFSNSFGSLMTILLFSLLSTFLTNLISLILAATIAMIWNYFANKLLIWRYGSVKRVNQEMIVKEDL